MGRPTKLNEKVTIREEDGTERKATVKDAVIAAISRGAYKEDAALVAGISEATLHNWMARGREHADGDEIPATERPYVEFMEAVEKAGAEYRLVALDTIRKAAEGNWTAAAWYLERTQPQRYGRRLHVKDDTPRQPMPVDRGNVAEFEAAFRESFGDSMPEIDPDNMLPSVALNGDQDASGNGAGPH